MVAFVIMWQYAFEICNMVYARSTRSRLSCPANYMCIYVGSMRPNRLPMGSYKCACSYIILSVIRASSSVRIALSFAKLLYDATADDITEIQIINIFCHSHHPPVQMLAAARRHSLPVPELHVRQCRAISARTGALRHRVPGAVLHHIAADRTARHSAGDRARPVSGPGIGARVARFANTER